METILNVTELFAKELQQQQDVKCIVTVDEKEVNERIGTISKTQSSKISKSQSPLETKLANSETQEHRNAETSSPETNGHWNSGIMEHRNSLTIIYFEEFVTGSFTQHRTSIDYEQNICVCFARLADLNATAMERFLLREDMMENIVKPYIRKLQARFDNNVKKYNFSYSGGRWDDNEVQIILRFTLSQTLPMC